MDVTSLLNRSEPVSRDHPRERLTPTSVPNVGLTTSSVLPTPSPERTTGREEDEDDARCIKGRRPWDAGGYSLPLHNDTKPHSRAGISSIHIRSESTGPGLQHISNAPESRGHLRHVSKESNGFDSSYRRGSQSLGFAHQGASLGSPIESPNEKRRIFWAEYGAGAALGIAEAPRHRFSDSRSSLSSYGSSSFSACHSRFSSMSTVSGIHPVPEMSSLDAKLAQLPESSPVPTLGEVLPPSPRFPLPSMTRGLPTPERTTRPGSPTDAVLNMRGVPDANYNSLEVPGTSSHTPFTSSSYSKIHKRTISAPDFATGFSNLPPVVSKHFVPVLPPPQHSMSEESTQARAYKAHPTRTQSFQGQLPRFAQHAAPRRDTDQVSVNDAKLFHFSHGPLDRDCVCMFVENCDTNSQLRKAISHFFGRNKICTRRVPEFVWVHFCRKHYQRGRYRNGGKYPQTQMDLVRLQIERMEQWSLESKAAGEGPFIASWTLAMRKREQNRIDAESNDSQAAVDFPSHNSSRVPQWMFQHFGCGHGAEHILAVVDRLREEIQRGDLMQVPDIEFLPEIIDIRSSTAGNKSAKVPKRKTSQGSNGFPASYHEHFHAHGSLNTQFDSREGVYGTREEDNGLDAESPAEKRQRTGEAREQAFSPRSTSGPPTPPSYPLAHEPRRAPTIVPQIQFRTMSSVQERRQFPERPPMHARYQSSPSYIENRSGGTRGSHHRAASEFKPINRAGHEIARPSSAGDGTDGGPAFRDLNLDFSFGASANNVYRPFGYGERQLSPGDDGRSHAQPSRLPTLGTHDIHHRHHRDVNSPVTHLRAPPLGLEAN